MDVLAHWGCEGCKCSRRDDGSVSAIGASGCPVHGMAALRDEVRRLRDNHEGAVDALAKIERVYKRTMPGPRDALRDQVLEIIAAYRSATGGQ